MVQRSTSIPIRSWLGSLRSNLEGAEALAPHGRPEIIITDQGSQSTSADFIKVLKVAEIAISMDGKGAQAAATVSGGQ